MKHVEIAAGYIGYHEKSEHYYKQYGDLCLSPFDKYCGNGNYTVFAKIVGHENGLPWCQTFVNFCFLAAYGRDIADKLLNGLLHSPSTMTIKNAFVANGQIVPLSSARNGDLVFRARNGGGHVGIVEENRNGVLVTIEGNTDAGQLNSSDGGSVARHIGANWQWCCRPDWSLIGWHWVQSNGKWFYQTFDGQNTYGWRLITETDNKDRRHWYYFDKTGTMLTGLQIINGHYYYFQPSGGLEGALCKTGTSGALSPWYV